MKLLFSGFTSGGTIKVILKDNKFDKIILFTPEKFINKAEDFLKNNKGEIKKINAFDLNSLMQVIGNTMNKYNKNEILVNITEGNNLMASCFLSASYYYGLKTVSVNEENIIELPYVSLKETRFLTDSAKKWLLNIKKQYSEGGIYLKELAEGISLQRLTTPLKILRKAGFIELENAKIKKIKSENSYGDTTIQAEDDIVDKAIESKRAKIVKLTPLGNLYSRFLDN